jgi:GNAT superfamily N-acetyltransferase
VPLFEPYRDRAVGDLPMPLTDLLIRPAVLDDVARLSEIEAAREGGKAAAFACRLERNIVSSGGCGDGLILVAHRGEELLGLGKTSYFIPANDAPANIAPRGWYLSGVIVVSEYRRRGIARCLTLARLDWIKDRDRWAYYFANIRNRVTIELHREFGFAEVTRDFTFPGATFEGGIGALFRAELVRKSDVSGSTSDWTRRPNTAG